MSDKLVQQATPRDWPAECWPTPEQLAAWLRVCTDEELLIFSARAIRDGQAADSARWAEGFRRTIVSGV